MKSDALKQIRVTKHAEYNTKTDEYEINVNFKKDFEHLNGDYEMELFIQDINAEGGSTSWKLGELHIWFKQGLEGGTNSGVRGEYLPKEVIEHIFPPPAQEGNIIVNEFL